MLCTNMSRTWTSPLLFTAIFLGFISPLAITSPRFDLGRGVLFELVPNPPDNTLPGTGNARLSLGVTDIRQATGELKARGVATTPVREEPGGLLSYFKDPDGNELCLWQNVQQRRYSGRITEPERTISVRVQG